MRQNELRGKLIGFFAHIYPQKAERVAVISVFYEYHSADEIDRALAYMADKGYLLAEEHPHPYKKLENVMLYKISPTGIDLKEGLMKDPGITIVE